LLPEIKVVIILVKDPDTIEFDDICGVSIITWLASDLHGGVDAVIYNCEPGTPGTNNLF
jgi:hypothetical protein